PQGGQREPLAGRAGDAQAEDGRGRCAGEQDGPDDLGADDKRTGLQNGVTRARKGATARHGRKAGVSDRRGVGDTDFEVQGRKIQSRGSSACSSLNRCEPTPACARRHGLGAAGGASLQLCAGRCGLRIERAFPPGSERAGPRLGCRPVAAPERLSGRCRAGLSPGRARSAPQISPPRSRCRFRRADAGGRKMAEGQLAARDQRQADLPVRRNPRPHR
ncbi:hypothetical protein SAMN04489859_105920, partial [Paracoccus alcaliphilus]